jgi:superfamily II DNA or RNA helicase
MAKTHLILTDDALTVVPSNDHAETFLSYQEKIIVKNGPPHWGTTVEKQKRFAFKVIRDNPKVIQTMQGFWFDLKRHLEEKGYEVTVEDLRQPFPMPRMDLMKGFRFSQAELLEDFLSYNMSGLLGAPTRYGKTVLMENTVRAFPGLTTVVTAPGVDLVKQLYEHLREALPHREVKMIGGSSRVKYPSEDITVVSMDSLDKADTGRTRLLLVDEPHAAVTNSRLPLLNDFKKARRFGYGATLTGRFDGKDRLITGLIGPVLAERTYLEAVAEKAICPLYVLFLRIPISKDQARKSWNRDKAYKNLFFQSDRIASITRKICRELLPQDWQTLMFIKNEPQAEFYLDQIGAEGTIAMAKRMSAAERHEVMELMKQASIKRCLATDIYSQGVTFSHVRAMINLAGGGANTTTIQKPGRLAEIRPDKNCGIIFDFMFYPAEGSTSKDFGSGTNFLFIDSRNRFKAYTDKGYTVIMVDTFGHLKSEFQKLM